MEKREYKSSGESVSLLGFGCMRFPQKSDDAKDIDIKKSEAMIDYAISKGVNYFDTAYIYHGGESERFIGRALSNYNREKYNLATKLPLWNLGSEADVKGLLDTQLKNCGVDHFDYYLLHGFNGENLKRAQKYHAYEQLQKKKAEGVIKKLGFSFHGRPDELLETVTAFDMDFVQIQLNYLDWDLQEANRQYEILEERNIPVIVMEPVRGGLLATLCEQSRRILSEANPAASPASWAMRYAASLPAVLTVLSGMSTLSQVEDNIKTLSDFKPLSKAEHDVIKKALRIFRTASTVPCTSCRYCMDCPSGVDIPKVFGIYNQYCISKSKDRFFMDYGILGRNRQAENCTDCGQCVKHCPQVINIPLIMKEINEFVKNPC